MGSFWTLNHLEESVRETREIDMMGLVRDNCLDCEMVIIPPEGQGELDLYRCKAVDGKYCFIAVSTPACIKKPLSSLDSDS